MYSQPPALHLNGITPGVNILNPIFLRLQGLKIERQCWQGLLFNKEGL